MNPKYILITEDTHYFNLDYNITQGMYRPLYIDKYVDKNYILDDDELLGYKKYRSIPRE